MRKRSPGENALGGACLDWAALQAGQIIGFGISQIWNGFALRAFVVGVIVYLLQQQSEVLQA